MSVEAGARSFPRSTNAARGLLLACAILTTVGCRTDRGSGTFPGTILMVSIDTTRADHIGVYGYPRAATPVIDNIANQGVRFARAYAAMPTTDPSHATMLTGEYPRTHGIVRNAARRSDPEAPSLGTWLQDRGYYTAAVTARLGLNPVERGIRGFDFTDSPQLPVDWRSASEIVDRTRVLLDDVRDRERLFLWVHLWEPHKPYEPSKPRRARASSTDSVDAARSDPPRFLAEGTLLGQDSIAASVRLYDQEIAAADDAVGEIVSAVARLRPGAGEPLVLIVSDHGESLAERQRARRIGFGHGALLYDEVVRVPWVLRWAGELSASVIYTPVSLADFAPTVTGLLDPLHALAGEGRNLAEYVRTGREPPVTPVIIDRRPFAAPPLPYLQHAESAWIEFPWKLIVNAGPRGAELYRLDADPAETVDLAAVEREREVRLRGRLSRWLSDHPLESTGDRLTRRRAAELEALRALGYVD